MEAQDDAQLGALDQKALDALVDAEFDPAKTPAPLRARCERLAAVLGVLDGPTAHSGDHLASRTMDGVRAIRDLTEDTLSRSDAAAMDAWEAAGYDLDRVSEPLRARALQCAGIADSITRVAPGAAYAPDLADRTFGLVMLAADRPIAKFEPGRAAPRVRWMDLIGMAAMLLVGGSVIVPLLSATRQQHDRGACTANLGTIASALSSYASTYRDSLPVASASMGGGRWSDVGGAVEHSNSANLFTLVRNKFAKVADLTCPANACACNDAPSPDAMDWRSIESVSYSYQIMFGRTQHGRTAPSRTAILADRSPVILRSLAHQYAIPTENSPNHSYRGQSILLCDGSVSWQSTPVLPSGDNIWLPWQVEEILRQIGAGEHITLEGKEMPGSDEDTFLAP